MNTRNPYRLEPVDNPRLLRTRRAEISRVVETVAPESGPGGHALVIGGERTGRTSLLQEVGRRASADRNALVVTLRLLDHDLTTSGVQRALLNATVEALVDGEDRLPEWYLAWCDRVHLRDRSTTGIRDLLMSSLVFAADAVAIVDRAVLERDLRTLFRLATENGKSRILVCIDDADELLEDHALIETMLDAVARGGDWSFALTTTTAGCSHLVEAVSPCLRRFVLLWLAPFWTPDKIRTCLTAPLDADDVKRLMPKRPMPLIIDVLRLTGGNPFEIALVAKHLWVACRVGEQECYELTPRVLERALSELALCTGAEREFVDGARAMQDLEPSQIGPALDLIALAELTTREIAIARMLGVPNTDNNISDRLLTASVDEEEARVVEELLELERRGVVTLDDDGGFTVAGGQPAVVALKYQAQSLLGPEKVDKPFGIPFLPCVGGPLAAEYARRAVNGLPGARRLASTVAFGGAAGSISARLRAALDARPFAGLDMDAMPVDEAGHDRMVEVVRDPSSASVVVVDFTLVAGERVLDWVEIWDVPIDADLYTINQSLSDALEGWQELTAAAGASWRGSHAVMFRAADAARALIQLCPSVSDAAVFAAWGAWRDTDRPAAPDTVLALVETTVGALRAHRVPDWERGWELSMSLSRLGFILSFYDDRLEEAREVLEQAKDPGPADGWVTDWNLSNIAARLGNYAEALSKLDEIAEGVRQATFAHLAMFVPGREAIASVITLDAASAAAVYVLQRGLIAYLAQEIKLAELQATIELCAGSGPVGAEVAAWALSSLATTQLPGSQN